MEKYEKILKEKGVSVTSARLDMLALLDKQLKPVTIEQLGSLLANKVHHTTLYRSLKVLVDKGVVYQADFHDGVAYFEYQGDHHHHHLVCTSCKSKEATDICVSSYFPEIQKKNDFTITNHVLEIFGLCKNCS